MGETKEKMKAVCQKYHGKNREQAEAFLAAMEKLTQEYYKEQHPELI